MRRHRRMVLIDRVIPFLAAIVGLLALAGAVLVQANVGDQQRRLDQQLAEVQASIAGLGERADALAKAADDGTAEGLLALQDRMNKVEAEWAKLPTQAVMAVGVPGAQQAGADAGAVPRTIDPNWPTKDCIPLGTRFMTQPGDSFPICQSPAVVAVSAITGDSVLIDGAGSLNEGATGLLSGTNCRIEVLSADAEGFAEMRVNCS